MASTLEVALLYLVAAVLGAVACRSLKLPPMLGYLVMGVLILPLIASISEDALNAVPRSLREAAYGLGATTWEVVWKVVLPYTKAGVIGGIMLGLGRALGETMAITFVIGNVNQLNSVSLFDAANSITSALANEFAEANPGSLHESSLILLGLILFLITFVVLAASKFLLARLERAEGGRT